MCQRTIEFLTRVITHFIDLLQVHHALLGRSSAFSYQVRIALAPFAGAKSGY